MREDRRRICTSFDGCRKELRVWPFSLLADVAQLVEQRFRKPQVTGSNPVVGSILRSQQHEERKLSRCGRSGAESFDPK
jgi:hypothetical protein